MSLPLNAIISPLESVLTEQQIVDISVQSFLSLCRVKPQINDDDYSKSEEQLLFEKNLQQVIYITSLTPIDEYLTDLLDFSTLNSSFCCRVEALFHSKMFDELLTLTNSLLVAIEQKHHKSNNSNNSVDSSDNLAPSPQSPKPLSISPTSNMDNKDYSSYILEDCSIVLRLLTLEVKVMTGQGDESMQQLHVLEKLLETSIKREEVLVSAITASATSPTTNTTPTINSKTHTNNNHHNYRKCQQWLYVIKSMKINILIRQHHLQTAASEILKIMQLPLFQKEESSQIVLLCLLSRLCIQLGAIKAAEQYYRKAYLLFDSSVLKERAQATEIIMSGNSSPENDVYDLVLITRGLIQFALNQYEEAMLTFNTIVDRYKQHHLLLATSELNLDPLSIDVKSQQQNINYYKKSYTRSSSSGNNNGNKSRRQSGNVNNSGGSTSATAMNVYFFSMSDFSDSILAIAVNNISVCALFLKQMQIAITNLESLIQLDPCEYIINSIVFNLCTLYDLSLTTDQSSVKKKCLYTIAQLYNVSDVTVPYPSFRL